MTAIPKNIAALREKISATKARIAQIESNAVPFPIEQAIARADAMVDAAAAQGRKNLRASVSELPFPESGEAVPALIPLQRLFVGGSYAAVDFDAVVGFVALFSGDAIRAAMRAELQAIYADLPKPMAAGEQGKAVGELRNTLLELEREEFAAVETARATGTRIDHRADINPAVMLGLAT